MVESISIDRSGEVSKVSDSEGTKIGERGRNYAYIIQLQNKIFYFFLKKLFNKFKIISK